MIASVAAGTTKYYKVVVCMWLEGEDKACTTANFLELTNAWTLDLEIQLGTGTVVDAVTSVVPAP